MTTPDATTEFFAELATRGREPLLRNTSGRLRLELAAGDATERWLLEVDKGDVTVSRKRGPADAVLHLDRSLFDALARGEANAMAAVLRGEIGVEGDLELMVAFQRLFPGPPSSRRTS